MSNQVWKHVEWISKATSRKQGEGKDAHTEYRLFKVPVPKVGSSLSQYWAELEQAMPTLARKLAGGEKVGLALTSQKIEDVWADASAIAESKAKDWIFANLGADAELMKLVTTGRMADAMAKAREALRANGNGEQCGEQAAKDTDKLYDAHWSSMLEAYDVELGLKPPATPKS